MTVKALVAQLCLTLCDPMYCSPLGSSVHGILQAGILGMGSHSFLQRIFPTQGSNPGLPHCRQILYHLNHQGSPEWQQTSLNLSNFLAPIVAVISNIIFLINRLKQPLAFGNWIFTWQVHLFHPLQKSQSKRGHLHSQRLSWWLSW